MHSDEEAGGRYHIGYLFMPDRDSHYSSTGPFSTSPICECGMIPTTVTLCQKKMVFGVIRPRAHAISGRDAVPTACDALLDYVFDSDSDWCMRQQLAPMFSGRGSAPVLHQSNSISFHKCC
jgi:hypothetical protein